MINNTRYLQNHLPKKQNAKTICFEHHDTLGGGGGGRTRISHFSLKSSPIQMTSLGIPLVKIKAGPFFKAGCLE